MAVPFPFGRSLTGDSATWFRPPQSPESEFKSPPTRAEGQLIAVEVQIEAYDLSDIDTVTGRAFVKLGVVLYWYDDRMIGWKDGAAPPNELWGPCLRLSNEIAIAVTQVVFDLEQPRTGRMKRVLNYTGLVKLDMTLEAFPFDISSVGISFRTSSDFLSHDMTHRGARSAGQVYQLWWPEDAKNRLRLRWHGRVHGWTLLGISTDLIHHQKAAGAGAVQKYTPTSLLVYFHVERMWFYFLVRALLPLWLTFGLSLSLFWLSPETATEDRLQIVLCCFVAVISLLFVVSTFLPVTSSLTIVDWVTLVTIVGIGVECVFCTIVCEDSSGWFWMRTTPRADMDALDVVHFRAVSSAYFIINVCLLWPAALQHYRILRDNFWAYRPHKPPEDAMSTQPSQDFRLCYLAEPSEWNHSREKMKFEKARRRFRDAVDPTKPVVHVVTAASDGLSSLSGAVLKPAVHLTAAPDELWAPSGAAPTTSTVNVALTADCDEPSAPSEATYKTEHTARTVESKLNLANALRGYAENTGPGFWRSINNCNDPLFPRLRPEPAAPTSTVEQAGGAAPTPLAVPTKRDGFSRLH